MFGSGQVQKSRLFPVLRSCKKRRWETCSALQVASATLVGHCRLLRMCNRVSCSPPQDLEESEANASQVTADMADEDDDADDTKGAPPKEETQESETSSETSE